MNICDFIGHADYEVSMRYFTQPILRKGVGDHARQSSDLQTQVLLLRGETRDQGANDLCPISAHSAPHWRSISAHVNDERRAPVGKGKSRQDGPCFAWRCQARRGGFLHG